MTCYIHDVPGRLRVKNPIFKNKVVQDDIKKLLSTLEGLGVVEFNATTGSVVVFYNPAQIHSNDIVGLLQRAGYFEPVKAITHDQYMNKAASKMGSIVGKAVLGAAVETAFEGSVLSFLALLI
jgi:hypothetical protein